MATMSEIARLTKAARTADRTDRGENRIPAVWRARVVYVRDVDGASRAGVYVTVPNFTQGEIHGPVQVVGDTPGEGDLVVAVAVEGRKNDWIIITPTGVADVESRLGEVEGAVVDLDDRLTSTHGDTANAIGILETQMEAIEEWMERLDAEVDPEPVPIPLEEPFEARRSPTWRVRGRVLELAGLIRANTTDFSVMAYFPDEWPFPNVGRVYEKLILNGGEPMGVTLGAGPGNVLTFGVNPLGVSRSTANFAQTATFSLDGVTIPLW